MIILELKKTLIGPIHINTWSCNCLRIAASAADGSSKLFITKSMPSPNDSVLHKWETELGPLVAMAGKPRRTSFEVKRQKRLQKKHRRSMFKGFLSKQYIIAFAAMDIYSNQFCSYDKKPWQIWFKLQRSSNCFETHIESRLRPSFWVTPRRARKGKIWTPCK